MEASRQLLVNVDDGWSVQWVLAVNQQHGGWKMESKEQRNRSKRLKLWPSPSHPQMCERDRERD